MRRRISAERDVYLRRVLSALPFRWHVAHAYASRETATYGGADHVVVDQGVKIGRVTRRVGDTLARPGRSFNALHSVVDDRLPDSRAVSGSQRGSPPARSESLCSMT